MCPDKNTFPNFDCKLFELIILRPYNEWQNLILPNCIVYCLKFLYCYCFIDIYC